MNKRKKIKTGFSLFELSIVILIVGILSLGAMQGGDLIRKAKISSAQTLTKSSAVGKMDNLVLWLETTMPQSFNDNEKVDGSKISIWYDISNSKVNPVNAIQNISANQPIYNINVINGLPSLKFTRANSSHMSVADGFDNESETITLFLVFQTTLDPNLEMNILEKWSESGPYPYVLRTTSGYYLAAYDGSNNPTVSGTTSRKSGTPHIISARRIRSGAMNIWINGTSEGGTTTDNTTFSANNINLFIGCRGNATLCVDGYISEIIIFAQALSDQERQDVEEYLSKKWGIKVS